jgi:deoxyribodipyrimidine photo-lyase
MQVKQEIVIWWLRRDLRLHDNAALYHALRSGYPVLPVFVFDRNILDKLEDKFDKRVDFIHQHLKAIKRDLIDKGSDIYVHYGTPIEAYAQLLEQFTIKAVYTNRDYEPYAKERDATVDALLKTHGAELKTYKDQCIFEYTEVLKDDSKPYTVFTPYSRKWKAKLNNFYLKPYPTEKYFTTFLKTTGSLFHFPKLEEMNFQPTKALFPSVTVAQSIIRQYDKTRNFPAINGTSRLGVHFRFGTISIREKAARALELNETYLNELIWRDFYMQILAHFPHVAKGAFKPQYDLITWRNNEDEFRHWCEGKTGYPIVDAGMRELNETGYMHNRVRMIVASFLTKHLLIDWRWGEAYFAKKLLDFDLSANNGGWQWAAGSGTDAAPYFRVFNPALQTDKFDPQLVYIKKWVPELNTKDYPQPIVKHEYARARCLEVYKKALAT